MPDLIAWLLLFLLMVSLLGIISYQLMCLTDLELDYINPYDSTSRINMFIVPEFIIQGLLCAVFLFAGHWVLFLCCLPYLYHNVTSYISKRHLLDVTEIYNQMNREKKKRFFKLAYVTVLLIVSLFWFLWILVED